MKKNPSWTLHFVNGVGSNCILCTRVKCQGCKIPYDDNLILLPEKTITIAIHWTKEGLNNYDSKKSNGLIMHSSTKEHQKKK